MYRTCFGVCLIQLLSIHRWWGDSDFPFPHRYQLHKSLAICCSLFILPSLDAGALLGFNLCVFFAWSHSFCISYVNHHCCILKTVMSYSLPLALILFLPPFSHGCPRKEFDNDISFMCEWSQVSYSFFIVQLWLSMLIITYYRKKLFLWGSSNTLIYGYSIVLLGVILLI